MKLNFSIRNQIILLLTCITWILGGCKEKDAGFIERKFGSFPQEVNAVSQQISLTNCPSISYPSVIVKCDTLLILLDNRAGSGKYVHLFSTNDYRYLYSLLKIGKGPNEYTNVRDLQIVGDTLVITSDNGEYLFSPLHELSDSTVFRTIKLSNDGGLTSNGYFYNSRMYSESMSGKPAARIIEIDKSGEITASFGSLKKGEEPSPAAYSAYISLFGGNGKTLVAALLQGDVLEVYDLDDHSQLNIVGPKGYPQFQDYKGFGINVGWRGYQGVDVTSEYIYAIYDGSHSQESLEYESAAGKVIRVFDLKGKPQLLIHLNRRASDLYVDEEEGKIYLTDPDSDEFLFTIDIPEI